MIGHALAIVQYFFPGGVAFGEFGLQVLSWQWLVLQVATIRFCSLYRDLYFSSSFCYRTFHRD
jgi:hypothetical protein